MKKILTIASLLISASSSFADSAWPLSQAMELQADTPVNRLQILGAHNAWNDSDATWANQRWALDKLMDNGVRNIDLDIHLDGGVVKYAKETGGKNFEGKLYVFDNRVVVDVNSVSPSIVSTCKICGTKSAHMVNCANAECNEVGSNELSPCAVIVMVPFASGRKPIGTVVACVKLGSTLIEYHVLLNEVYKVGRPALPSYLLAS